MTRTRSAPVDEGRSRRTAAAFAVSAPARAVLVGIDTGGTFTDLVCFAGGRLHTHKLPSTPDDPARAVLQGLAELLEQSRSGRRIDVSPLVSYASTVATNAVLERKGARVALLTTAGVEDVIEIGRQTRPELYALEPERPAPLVSRRHRHGVAERITHDGRVLIPLTDAAVRAAVAAARTGGADAVAVCLLHSYAHPSHERRLGRAVRVLGIECSLSHELIGEYREYERLSTTVLNAYVAPVMTTHLATLARGIGASRVRVLQSNGGAVSLATAGREAVRTLLSGPAAGVIGAVAAGRRVGVRRLITFDMGGTSTDVSLIDGEPQQQTEWEIGGFPVKVPAIDIHTVGAGGGSLASVDPGGVLKVGPESAGAVPGPACYGRGEHATVTDADLVLGRLAADAFLGGRMRLDVTRAQRAVNGIARKIGRSNEAAAEGIVQVINAGMERAIRRISIERGHDPREYTLVAFGGAAGMHACALADGLGIVRVLVPFQPGLLSAHGAVSADVRRDYVQTVRLRDPRAKDLAPRFAALLRRARRDMQRESIDDRRTRPHPRTPAPPHQRLRLATFVDCRYPGQSFEIRVPMRAGFSDAFHDAHQRLYGYADRARGVEVVNLRVTATATSAKLKPGRIVRQAGTPTPHRLRWNGRWLNAHRIAREALPIGKPMKGPLLITELSATTFLPPGWRATLLTVGDLLLECGSQQRSARSTRDHEPGTRD